METRPSVAAMETRPSRAKIHFSINIHEGQRMHRPNLLDSSDCFPAPPAADSTVPPFCPVVIQEGCFVFVLLKALKPLLKLPAFSGLTKNDSAFPLS